MGIFNFNKNIYSKFGYISDQKGILSRYNREKKNWDEHLNNCKKYIITYCNSINTKNIAILGSGWLLDVPLEFLSKKFNTVYLIDVNHPSNTNKIKKLYPNVEFVTDDISGGSVEFANNCVNIYKKSKIKIDIKDFEKKIYNPSINNTAFISLNILNQLDILLIDYLNEFNIYNEDEIIQLRKIIQNNHINFLTHNKSCLISDIEEYIINTDETIEKTNILIFSKIPNGNNYQEWIWKFDTKKRYIENRKTYFKVIATELV